MSQDKKIPRPVTKESLRNAALNYIDRFATSRHNLRHVLVRRVQKSNYYHDTSIQDGIDWIEELLDKLEQAKFIDDARYAEGRAGALHRKGTSQRVIRMKLMEKGLSEDHINKALEALREESQSENLERDAAIALARRRRLGPWRLPEKREDLKEKDLAAMARAGFSYDLAREIIEAETIEDLED
ncbi:Regulatory protein RecX [Candidatus Terasakiella magnetica]|uniref:Regulatory protein RecX n=1 Tax=Candidatus Terasakiella magnetica TaxID=1867952 RepID=A0A1C3RGS3_9PROT|nr:regulatory protein RecX [Candidatus Terasakiella magnetica]SCA56448.1 Regulatory protein RecX [Candidatus Terasakiella magnetica]